MKAILGAAASLRGTATLVQSAMEIECFDFVEVTLNFDRSPAENPFVQCSYTGDFGLAGSDLRHVEGFCDSEDGRTFRIRFMPLQPGRYIFEVTFDANGREESHSGEFNARQSRRKGPIRVDGEHPWHFVWESDKRHFFWNSTTAYWLLGWKDERIIQECLDRMVSSRINRIRVALSGRTHGGSRWKEDAIKPDDQFQFRLEPWRASRSADIENPGYDVTRFNLEHFRKCERMLRHARERDLIVSLIFHLDGRDKGVDPFGHAAMGGGDEQQYYRYCISRFAGFSNVMWDVTNEWHLFRNDPWVEQMGALIKEYDPYDHLTSVHGTGTFPFRTSTWCDYAMFQSWDEHGAYQFMLRNRREQAATGHPMPQVNEEYGYEDHYPFPWGEGRKWPARVADNRRRIAWEITMAGCYQTTGERANIPHYGGWITGRGNKEMQMLQGYAVLRDFFERLPWWRLDPRPDLVSDNAFCLAEPGKLYVIYLPKGGSCDIQLEQAPYSIRWFDPRSGRYESLKDENAPAERWISPTASDNEDWVMILELKA